MTKFIDQTITFTYEELKVLRNALIAYEDVEDKYFDALYDKVEHGIHDSLGERIRVTQTVCADCDYCGTTMCPLTHGDNTCQLREDMVETYRNELLQFAQQMKRR